MGDDAVRRRVHVPVVTANKPGIRSYAPRSRTDGPLLTPETIRAFLAEWDRTHDVASAAVVAGVSLRKRYWLQVLLRYERGVVNLDR